MRIHNLIKRILNSIVHRSGIMIEVRRIIDRQIFESKVTNETMKRMNHLLDLFDAHLSKFSSSADLFRRYGAKDDGGYVTHKIAGKSDVMISIGIGRSIEFELAVSKVVHSVDMFDHTISWANHKKKMRNKKNLYAYEIGLEESPTESNLASLKQIFQITQTRSNRHANFLKMDCEGAEVDSLIALLGPEMKSELESLDYLLVEYHHLSKITEDEFWEKTTFIFSELLQIFDMAYIHPNNYSGYSRAGNRNFPFTIEFFLISKKLQESFTEKPNSKWRMNLPLFPNNSHIPEIEI